MRRFRALIKKEITHMIRDPRTLIFVFLMPILQLVLLGYANNTDVKNVSTVIFNQDNSEASRALLDSFQATGYFSFDYSVYSQNEVDKTIASGKARVGIVIPPDYAMRLASGENSSVLVLIDGSDPTIASYVLSAAQLAGQAHGVSIRAQQLSLSGAQMAGASGAGPVDVRTRVLYNPDLQGSYNIVPGLIAIILFQTATSLTALAIVKERERGTLEQLFVTPIGRTDYLVGKLVPYVGIAFIQVGVTFVVGTLWFQVPFRGSLLVLLGGLMLFMLSALGLGMLVSLLSRTRQQAQQTSMFLQMPSMMLSGFMFPIDAFPRWLFLLTYLIPLRYILVIVRSNFLKGSGFSALWPQFVAMAVFSVLIFLFGLSRFQKRLAD